MALVLCENLTPDDGLLELDKQLQGWELALKATSEIFRGVCGS